MTEPLTSCAENAEAGSNDTRASGVAHDARPWAIRMENVGKRYLYHRGGVRSRGADVREALMHRLGRLFGNAPAPPEKTKSFWALRHIDFEVKQGETIGIIGRNGAGKSTLLKILSRIIPPTEGVMRYRGNLVSLLEIGSGFHGDLTGRENIFLNGAILGVNRAEISRRCHEIVQFADIGEFLDTPVKFYSSGMYVRLAFAIAAHLQTGILVVDEVLSVGDADFRKKSMAKMTEIAKGGRTVIFVSHSMGSIAGLCERTLLLEKGTLVCSGKTHEVISRYESS